MPYSDSHRYVFVAVPKTGSTSLRAALMAMHAREGGELLLNEGRVRRLHQWRLGLRSLPGSRTPWFKHLSAIELRHLMGESFDRYFKFAIVRNPWSRAVSRYHFQRRDVRPRLLSRLRGEVTRSFHDLSFDQWVQKTWKFSRGKPGGHINMVDKLIDREGRMVMDFVGALENYQQDLAIICCEVGLQPIEVPRENVAKNNSRPYTDFYTPELVEMVGEIYRRDVDAFGYSFEGFREDSPLSQRLSQPAG